MPEDSWLRFAGADSWARSYLRALLLPTPELLPPVASITEQDVHQLHCPCHQWEDKSTRKQLAVTTLPAFLNLCSNILYTKAWYLFITGLKQGWLHQMTGIRLMYLTWEVSLACQSVCIYCRLYMQGRVNNEGARIYKPATVVVKLW